MTRILILLIITFSLNSCRTIKENDKYGIRFFIKSVYNDSDVVNSGSLISEPFQVKVNNYPSVIILQLLDSSHFKETPSAIKEYLPKGVKEINFNEMQESFMQLETEKIIVQDYPKLLNNEQKNYLGFLKLLKVFSNATKTNVYIYYYITDYSQRAYASSFSEFHLLNGKWTEVNSKIIERN